MALPDVRVSLGLVGQAADYPLARITRTGDEAVDRASLIAVAASKLGAPPPSDASVVRLFLAGGSVLDDLALLDAPGEPRRARRGARVEARRAEEQRAQRVDAVAVARARARHHEEAARREVELDDAEHELAQPVVVHHVRRQQQIGRANGGGGMRRPFELGGRQHGLGPHRLGLGLRFWLRLGL